MSNKKDRRKQAEKIFSADNTPLKVSGYRLAEMAIYLVALVLGALFIYTSAISVDIILPLYALFLIAGAVLRFIDLRKSEKPPVLHYFLAGLEGVLGVVLLVVTLMRFLAN